MKIEVFMVSHNEEFMIPYVMRHYSRFAEVTILENNSTDRTVEIARSLGAKVIELDIPDNKDNKTIIDIKNECWKDSKADWVIVVDTDEFIYHPNIRNELLKTNATILRTTWYEMFSDHLPTKDGQIYEELALGQKHINSKLAIFRPDQINEMNWGVGCHDARPEGNVIIENSELKTLHYRHLSLEYLLERNRRDSARLSAFNRKMGWSTQYDVPEDIVTEKFNTHLKNSKKVIL
jgi:glycosyltransferase involved in cell wall biosynthesis